MEFDIKLKALSQAHTEEMIGTKAGVNPRVLHSAAEGEGVHSRQREQVGPGQEFVEEQSRHCREDLSLCSSLCWNPGKEGSWAVTAGPLTLR